MHQLRNPDARHRSTNVEKAHTPAQPHSTQFILSYIESELHFHDRWFFLCVFLSTLTLNIYYRTSPSHQLAYRGNTQLYNNHAYRQ